MGMGSNRKPVEIARGLSKKYDVCLVVISTAEGYHEKKLLKAVASVNECSRVIPFDALLKKPEYFAGALFVMDVKIIRALATREKVVGFKMDNILFDFNESNIRPEFYDELNTLGKFLQDNPDAYMVLAGFTDSTGPQEYNLGLSRRRAESVGIYLLKNFHIDDQRIVLHWYGEAAPVASNETAEGRSENRRVASIVGGL